jgi:nucleoside-diphosphate-sugar epimerase
MTRVALIGGCGFVGEHLSKELVALGCDVLVFDAMPASPSLLAQAIHCYMKGDIRSKKDLDTMIRQFQPNVIVHLASWGMSGAPMLSKKCFEINVQGTQNLIDAVADSHGICTRIVYTSTYNTVYGGTSINYGDESLPHFPLDRHADCYSPSKAQAEKLILEANGLKCKGTDEKLMTTVLRPAAIYGCGEMRHFPRIIQHMDSGIFKFCIGDATVDWLYIDNLTQAFVLAIDKLLSAKSTIAVPCGRTYFISDGTPISQNEFFKPLCDARGIPHPSIFVSTTIMLYLGWFLEKCYHYLGVEPFLTRTEVYKVGVTHYFSVGRARKELEYSPRISSQVGSKIVADYYKKKGLFPLLSNDFFFSSPSLAVCFLVCFGLVVNFLVAFEYPTAWHNDSVTSSLPSSSSLGNSFIPLIQSFLVSYFLQPIETFGLLVFQTHANIKIVFFLALIIHLCEAVYAAYFAWHIGCKRTWLLWFVQTLILGGPSLILLFKRANMGLHERT